MIVSHKIWHGTFFFFIVLGIMALGFPAKAQEKMLASVKTQQAPLHKYAYSESEILVTLARGDEVSVEEWKDEGFCLVVYGSEKGYIKSNQLKRLGMAEDFSPARKGSVNAENVNLRAKAETTSSIISVLKKGSIVNVLGRNENWYKISVGVHVGFVNKEYIDIDLNNDVLFDDQAGTLRMGMSGKEVARMQEALAVLGYYEGEINGTFGARTRDALKNFQKENGLTYDGNATQATLNALYRVGKP